MFKVEEKRPDGSWELVGEYETREQAHEAARRSAVDAMGFTAIGIARSYYAEQGQDAYEMRHVLDVPTPKVVVSLDLSRSWDSC
jgi:predicted NUDIX family NTP pyrophosphohydrolase